MLTIVLAFSLEEWSNDALGALLSAAAAAAAAAEY